MLVVVTTEKILVIKLMDLREVIRNSIKHLADLVVELAVVVVQVKQENGLLVQCSKVVDQVVVETSHSPSHPGCILEPQ